MESVYGWVKSIIYYMIFLSAANNLLADSKYEKYVRLFAGMVLILIVVSPLTGSLRLNEQISSLFQSITFQADAKDLKADLWGMEDKRMDQMIHTYEEAVEKDIAAMAEGEGLSCREAKVTIDRDKGSSQYGKVTEIQLTLWEEEKEETESPPYTVSRPVTVEGSQVSSIQVERIRLREEDGSLDGGSLSFKIKGLTGKVAGCYGLERSDIKVQWKDD